MTIPKLPVVYNTYLQFKQMMLKFVCSTPSGLVNEVVLDMI
jgi:hypothetical protein